MRLLGTPLIVVLAVLTTLLPLMTVWLWSKVGGPRAARLLARLGLVLTSQLAAILLVAALANDYGYFYGSWTGLFRGVDQMVTGAAGDPIVLKVVKPTGGQPAVRDGIKVIPDPGFSTRAEWHTRGRLETVRIRGAITGLHSTTYVYLPPQYFQPRYAHSEFPAVEALAGYPGASRQLPEKLRYQKLMLRELHRHRAKPMVIVMSASAVTAPRDGECTDIPGGPQVETFFAQDLPREITQHYRVQPDGWGTIGDSTGGYCAAKIAMMNPYTFHAAASLSGYFTPLRDRTTGDLWGGDAVVRRLNNLDWRLRHLPVPPISMLVATSRDERGRYGYVNSLHFLHLVRLPMRVSSIVEPHGGHNFTTWQPELPKALAWLSARLPPVTPA